MRTLITILCSILLATAANAGPNLWQRNSSAPLSNYGEEMSSPVGHILKSQSKAFSIKKDKNSRFHSKRLNMPNSHARLNQAPRMESSEELYQVYLDFVEPEGYELLGSALGKESASWWEDAYDGMMLPAGKYCFVAIYSSSDGTPQRIIIKNVNISADTTILLDGNDASQRVNFLPLLPNGAPILGATLDEYWEVKEPGNISTESNGYINSALISKKWGLLFYYETTFGKILDSATGNLMDLQKAGNFLINPDASGDLSVSQYCSFFGADNESCYLLQLNSDGLQAQTVKNNPADYISTSYSDIMTTDYYEKNIEIKEKNMIFGWYIVNLGIPTYMNYAQGDIVNNAASLIYCLPDNSESIPTYTVFPFVDNYDYGEDIDLGGGLIKNTIYRITPSAFRIQNGELKMMVAPMLDGPYSSKFFNTKDGVDQNLSSNGQPSYSFQLDQSLQIAGDNAPFLQVIDNSIESKNFSFQFLMLGRVGESPIFEEECYGEYNGQSVTIKSTDDMETWKEIWYPFWVKLNDEYSTYTGTVKFNVQSAGTIWVDDSIPSFAKTENVWNFAQKDDRIIPQLTMFQFRNKDNVVTDRFLQSSDGTLTLSCADFNNFREFVYDESGNIIGINEYAAFNSTPEVMVEYSPINRNDWQPLEVEEKPEEFYMPGYGSFFRGNLASVDRKAVGGWFDIRFKLSDNGGNKQTVIVSPAFNIASLSGIESATPDNVAIRVDGNNIIAPDDALIYNTAGIPVGRHSLPNGIYLVTCKGRTSKLIIR